ncbi:MAG: hypothetical protein Q8L98_07120 [Chlamydiales bacterium]|nr:hypothetical protein [Chlamydiales bacterium]
MIEANNVLYTKNNLPHDQKKTLEDFVSKLFTDNELVKSQVDSLYTELLTSSSYLYSRENLETIVVIAHKINDPIGIRFFRDCLQKNPETMFNELDGYPLNAANAAYACSKIKPKETVKHISSFHITDQEALQAIATECAFNDPIPLFEGLNKFSIENIEKFKISLLQELVLTENSTYIAKNIKKFNINNQNDLDTIAITCLQKNLKETIDHLENFLLERPEKHFLTSHIFEENGAMYSQGYRINLVSNTVEAGTFNEYRERHGYCSIFYQKDLWMEGNFINDFQVDSNISNIGEPSFISLLFNLPIGIGEAGHNLGIMIDFLENHGYAKYTAELKHLHHRIKEPSIKSQANTIYDGLMNENKPQLLFFLLQRHIAAIRLVPKGDFIFCQLFNSGNGLNYHINNQDPSHLKYRMLQVTTSSKELTLDWIKQILSLNPSVDRGYEMIFSLQTPETSQQEEIPVIWKSEQKGGNCSLKWMFHYLKYMMSERDYKEMCKKLYRISFEEANKHLISQEIIETFPSYFKKKIPDLSRDR